MKRSPHAAARRYAQALLEVALAKADPGAVRRELHETAELLAANRALLAALTHPGLGAERRQKLVKAVFGGRVSELMERLLALLAGRDRLALLPHIATAFAHAWNEQRGVVAAEAVSAIPLEPAQQGALARALETAAGRQVELTTRTEPGLLGGVVVTMGGRTYDGSVRAQLQMLRRRLMGGARA